MITLPIMHARILGQYIDIDIGGWGLLLLVVGVGAGSARWSRCRG